MRLNYSKNKITPKKKENNLKNLSPKFKFMIVIFCLYLICVVLINFLLKQQFFKNHKNNYKKKEKK